MDRLKLKGAFLLRAHDQDGNCIWEEQICNTTLTAGHTDLLAVTFAGGTQKSNWYFGLIDNSGFSSISASDTAASHSGWSESTAYSEATRQAWSGAAAGSVITNAGAAVITANATVTLKGAFVISDNTKGGTSGVMWSAGAFSANQVLASGQTLSLFYTLTLS